MAARFVILTVCAVSGAACRHSALEAGAGGAPDAGPGGGVTPEQSSTWTWSPCGSIPAAPNAVGATFSPDGQTVAVLDETGAVTLFDASGAARPVPLAAAAVGAVAFSPDGSRLATTGAGGARLLGVLDGAVELTLAPPTDVLCGNNAVGFSADGAWVIAHGGGPTCVWNASDGTPIAELYDFALDAAIRGPTIVTLSYGDTTNAVSIVTRDSSGQELARRTIEVPDANDRALLLSPAGDRLAVDGNPAALYDIDTGAELVTLDRSYIRGAAFSYGGDRVLFGDGVFQSADGARLATVPQDDFPDVAALAPDGQTAAVLGAGMIGLRAIASPGLLRAFGPPSRRSGLGLVDPLPVGGLALSADGGTLVSQAHGGFAFGLHVAARFADSATLWWTFPDQAADISADGRLVGSSGENGRALLSGTDGRIIWGSPNAPSGPDLRCLATQLRLSTTGRWAAGEGYGETMDVFDATAPAGFPAPLVALAQTTCQDTATFSHDDRLMATSTPSLYATGPGAGDWRRLWGGQGLYPTSGGNPPRAAGAWGNDVRFSPDETAVLVSRCADWSCAAQLYSVADGAVLRALPQLTAPHPSFSPEGHWVVAGGTLLHLPSGVDRPLDASASITTAIFAPNGDVIAGASDASLTRYCRNP